MKLNLVLEPEAESPSKVPWWVRLKLSAASERSGGEGIISDVDFSCFSCGSNQVSEGKEIFADSGRS